MLLLHSEVATPAGPYFDFATLGRAVLRMTATARAVPLSNAMHRAGLRLVTLTNSSQGVVDEQMRNAGLDVYFERNFSVDQIRGYKPAPEPYLMVASELGVKTGDLRMVAAHAWDLVGAMQAGCAVAFVARPGKVFFPLVQRPDIEGPDLAAVAERIIDSENSGIVAQ